ncbi:MAG: carboxypeptidase-like regulatory domain-containing protein [Verrucomicrobia bacterium]|nr:carboxypeptidase-like regulatory domain-containing protein [Verrucomicrobiota bacterium]
MRLTRSIHGVVLLALTIPASGGSVSGSVDVLAKDGAPAVSFKSATYNDPRIRHAERMDYRKPGNIVVHLEPLADTTVNATTGTHLIELKRQRGRLEFIPSFSAVPAGTVVHFRNLDAKAHILYSRGAVNRFQLLLAARGEDGSEQSRALKTIDVVDLYALDVDGLEARLVITGPFAAVLQRPGKFHFKGVPAGRYRLKAWHDRLPAAEQDVDVAAEGTVEVNLVLDMNRIPEVP